MTNRPTKDLGIRRPDNITSTTFLLGSTRRTQRTITTEMSNPLIVVALRRLVCFPHFLSLPIIPMHAQLVSRYLKSRKDHGSIRQRQQHNRDNIVSGTNNLTRQLIDLRKTEEWRLHLDHFLPGLAWLPQTGNQG
jgi:hypothetical protein